MTSETRFHLADPTGRPGPDALVAAVSQAGIVEIIPGALGVNVFSGPAVPWALDEDGFPLRLLCHAEAQPGAANEFVWSMKQGPLVGDWKIRFHAHGFRLEYSLTAQANLQLFCPLSLLIHSQDGWILLPERELPFDPTDKAEVSQTIALGDSRPLFVLNSQGGFAVRVIKSLPAHASIRLQRDGEEYWRTGLALPDIQTGAKLSGSLELRVIPFNGAVRLEQLDIKPLDFSNQATVMAESYGEQRITEFGEDGQLEVDILGLPVRVAAFVGNRPILKEDVQDIRLTVENKHLGDRPVREVILHLRTRKPLEHVRFEAQVDTPCGNPDWDGDATVMIPGNMARCNYHPRQPHGGGPKWGPSPIPVFEENMTHSKAEGACHGWTFAASRLPQVWAAAADRRAGKLVWIGTSPGSPLGENCAGFVSPAGGRTTLKLATPTTYEPWIPLGYSRMRKEARHGSSRIDGGHVVRWTFWIATEDTGDLNAWGAYDKAVYTALRPSEPEPVKLGRDRVIRTCATALHDQFYLKEQASITYATGPRGHFAQVGFTGMAHSALVLLWAGQVFNEEHWREAGRAVLDTAAEMFRTGPGFPYVEVNIRRVSSEADRFRSGSGEPGYVTMVAFDNLAEALRREHTWGREHEGWAEGLRRCADCWVANQSTEGAYPHFGPDFGANFGSENNYEATNIEAGVIANMIDAYEFFGDEKYLDSARKAATHYGRHLDDGRLYGGPGDIRALVNSEVPMFFLRGFRRLYETTMDSEHRRWMLAAADWRYAFQYAHSWAVDHRSPLWRQGWSGLGSESASACNLHTVAFGCLNVPDEWALWAITRDDYHRHRCRDLARYSTQQYARFPGDLGFSFAGAGTESWWASDTLWGKGHPHVFHQPDFNLGYMSWVTGWSGYGALWARELGIEF